MAVDARIVLRRPSGGTQILFAKLPLSGNPVNRGTVLHCIYYERPLFAALQEASHVRRRSYKNIPYVY